MLATVATAVASSAAPSDVIAAVAPGATSAYEPVEPVRLADTRASDCGCTRLDSSTIRVVVAGRAGLPDEITAVAVTVTATPTLSEGFVTAYPSGSPLPLASTLNTRPDRVTSNSTIVPVGDNGALELFHIVEVDLIVDVTGVFVEATTARAGRFVPLATRRLVDTRDAGGNGLGPNGDLTVPMPDGVAADATGLVVNVTSAMERAPSHLSVRRAGASPNGTSFLNPNGSGLATAASIVVPVSPSGFTIRSLNGGHVIVDAVGWFTGPGADESTQGLFVPTPPTRLLDTREEPWRLYDGGTIELPMPMDGASAAVTNVTVTSPDRAGFLVAYAAGTSQPDTSALNPTHWNHTVANTAITRVAERGIAYHSMAGTDLVVDLSGWFVGTPQASTSAPRPNVPSRSRVLLVGDSTLAGLDVYTDSLVALRGFDAIVDAESCRRLLRPSCLSNVTGRTPNTAVEAILTTPGDLDIVVVKAGYNDWFSDFPREFDAVVNASRAKGAHTVLWLTQNETVRRPRSRLAYEENNVDIRWLTPLPQYSDVLMADWLVYSDARQDWFFDGTHTHRSGAYAITDYVARWIAAIEHRPCPRPWGVGGTVPDPCPPPELVGPVPDPIGVNL